MCRETDPAWRSRDLPPSPNQAYTLSKIVSWLDRGGNINETRMDKERGQSFLIQAAVNNHESLVAELLRRGADVNLYARGKNALHFAAVLGHSNVTALLLRAGADWNLRVAEDNSDYTECDGMTALQIVEHKLVTARDPLRERYLDMRDQVIRGTTAPHRMPTVPAR